MRRLFLIALLIISFLGVPGGPAQGGGIIHKTSLFNVSLESYPATQIPYPALDPSMVDIHTYGDFDYMIPEYAIDLTASMIDLEWVRFSLYGHVQGTIFSSWTTGSEEPFAYRYDFSHEWLQPNPDRGFGLESNTFFINETGPGEAVFFRYFEIHFELDEYLDHQGYVQATTEGFDKVPSNLVYSKLSNFLIEVNPDNYLDGGYYIWPGHRWDEVFEKPDDTVVILLPPVRWSGQIDVEYGFSLNYDAIDHSILFEQFRDDFVGWDVGWEGHVDLVPHGSNFAAKMTTSSPVSISRLVDTPDMPLLLMFNHAFLTDSGSMQVTLDDHVLLTLSADNFEKGAMEHQRILIADRSILGMDASRLAFTLDGPTGAEALLDNIGLYAVKETASSPSDPESGGDNGGEGGSNGGGGGCFISTIEDL